MEGLGRVVIGSAAVQSSAQMCLPTHALTCSVRLQVVYQMKALGRVVVGSAVGGLLGAAAFFAVDGLMPSQGNAQYRNEAGGNLYGDSNVNWRADPNLNWEADPNLNWEADPNLNWEADPSLNACADPSISSMGCR